MITGKQIRAARGLLGWSARILSEKSGVSLPTIQRMEKAPGVPASLGTNLMAVRNIMEDSGIQFISENGGGVGVRFIDPVSLRSPLQ
jgi:hypothetical protein